MPPDGYTTVTVSDELAEKLVRIMNRHNRPSSAEAIKYAVDLTLVREDDITIKELVQLLADRVDELE
jgi:Arc/MetJ-type ribon-helix-helix transcriptional regulator